MDPAGTLVVGFDHLLGDWTQGRNLIPRDDHRDVVSTAAVESLVNERLGGIGRLIVRAQDPGDRLRRRPCHSSRRYTGASGRDP